MAEDPANANVLYNLACAEGRGGRPEAALKHLREAVAVEPRFRQNALDDPDLAVIRDDDRFPSPPP